MIDVSVVVPLFNEVGNVERLCRELSDVLSPLRRRFEVILVDDASSDGTFDAAKSQVLSDDRIRAIRLSRNCGQTSALQAGFDASRGSIIVTLDGDLQNDPADIPRLLDAIADGADIVIGWRKRRVGESWSRITVSRIANWIIRRSTRLKIHDHGCGLKAFRRELVARQGIYSDMHRLMVPFIGDSDLRIDEIEVNHRPRSHGRSSYGGERIWKVTLDLCTVVLIGRYRSNPGLYFSLWSLPFTFLGVVAVAGAVAQYWWGPTAETPSIVWPGVALLSAFAVLHFLSMAFLGELVRALPHGHLWTPSDHAGQVEAIER
jgi:glycosyltransferase involved in cell wall biosynthesis